MERILESLFVIFRDLWILGNWGEKTLESLELSKEEKDFLLEESRHWPIENLRFCLENQAKMLGRLRYGIRTDVLAGLLLQGFPTSIPLQGKDSVNIHGKQYPPSLKPEVQRQAAVPSLDSRPAAATFTGHQPEQRKTEAGAREPVDQEMIRSFWARLLGSEDPEDRLTVAALSSTSVFSGGDGIILRFEEKDRFGFELVRLEKNLRRFTSLKERELGPLPVLLCCGDECVRAESAAVPDTGPVPGGTNVPPWEKRKSALDKGGNGRKEQAPGEEVTQPEGGAAHSPLEEMMGWFGGEVLLVREEGDGSPTGDFEDGGVTD